VVAATVFEPSTVREHGHGGRAEVVVLDREVVEVGGDTPLRADVVERAGADGGGGGIVLEEALRAAAPEAPSAMEEAPRVAVPECWRYALEAIMYDDISYVFMNKDSPWTLSMMCISKYVTCLWDYALYDDCPKRSLVERAVWTRSQLD